ncbi:hypothetical protein [Blastococcus sp. TF02A-35]|uniref:hypothetical protein n=1 Tax=Blastococcus sp. TF02A-35 TaxID=2559612 RepID=UPI001073BD3A|nr:hypothetical protein [Blastococcus sp. TF02A_35]TFV47161.1 hypothetical protein E4P43_15485 [Blastococcus sp. TF02A_35]
MSAPESPAAEPVALLDAVCCIHFCAAGKAGLLLAILMKLNWEIQVPAEVSEEVLGKKGKYPALPAPWRRFIAHDRVRVLEKITIDRADQAAVRDTVARLRGTDAALALGARKDLGEHLVIGHGIVLRDAGRRVYVLMDEQTGSDRADAEGLGVIDIEQLLLLGHRLQVSGLQTRAEVKAVYDAIEPYGESLRPWKETRLRDDVAAKGS